MIEPLAVGIAVAAAVPVLWSLVLIVRRRPIDDLMVWMVAVIELALIVLAVGGVVGLVRTDRAVSGPTFVAYLIGVPLILPAAVLWGAAERTRAGTLVVFVAALAIPVLMLRVLQVWAGGR